MLLSFVLICKCCLVLVHYQVPVNAGIVCNECKCPLPPRAGKLSTSYLITVAVYLISDIV